MVLFMHNYINKRLINEMKIADNKVDENESGEHKR